MRPQGENRPLAAEVHNEGGVESPLPKADQASKLGSAIRANDGCGCIWDSGTGTELTGTKEWEG
jgi:hypothetical protein